jgi:hypothetical protein
MVWACSMLMLSTSPFSRVGPLPAPRNSVQDTRSSKSRRAHAGRRLKRTSALPDVRVGPQTISRECYGLSLFSSGGQYAVAAELGNQL